MSLSFPSSLFVVFQKQHLKISYIHHGFFFILPLCPLLFLGPLLSLFYFFFFVLLGCFSFILLVYHIFSNFLVFLSCFSYYAILLCSTCLFCTVYSIYLIMSTLKNLIYEFQFPPSTTANTAPVVVQKNIINNSKIKLLLR
ncbi:unnamed protein product [Vicia faba]|uniref:Uncharacterized protein n=1 Tax=Vicia faba TaxID=3906 RepID=A0AAV1AZU7_VICFA|nr:unnamed protein product [Vicia faba]